MRNRGIGIIEVMAALGILSTIVTSVMVANRSMIQDVGRITYAYEAQNILRDIRGILADYNSCTLSMKGLSPDGGTVGAIKYKSSLSDEGTTRYQTGVKIRSNAANLTIESMTLSKAGDTKLLPNETYLIIKFQMSSNRLALPQEKILINYVAVSSKITNCYVASNKNQEFWARMADDPDSIYYYGRLQLGGGTETSTARLVVNQSQKVNPSGVAGKDPYTDGKGVTYCPAGNYWFDVDGDKKLEDGECFPVTTLFYGAAVAAPGTDPMDAVTKGQTDTLLTDVISFYAALPTATPDATGTACHEFFGHDPLPGEWMGDYAEEEPEPACCPRCPGKACEDFFGHRMCIPRAEEDGTYIGALADQTVVCAGNYYGKDLNACHDACVNLAQGGCDYDVMWQCKSKAVSLYCGDAGSGIYRCYAWCGSVAPSPIPTPLPTNTPDPGATDTPTKTPDPTNTPEPTAVPEDTPVPTDTPIPTPTITPYQTNTPIPACDKDIDGILQGKTNEDCEDNCCSATCFSDLVALAASQRYFYCGTIRPHDCSSGDGLICDASSTNMQLKLDTAYSVRRFLATCEYQAYDARAVCHSRHVHASSFTLGGGGSKHIFNLSCGAPSGLPSNVPALSNGAICAVTNYMCENDTDQFRYCNAKCSNWTVNGGTPTPISAEDSFYKVYACPGEVGDCDNNQPGLLCDGTQADFELINVMGPAVCHSRAMSNGICYRDLATVPMCNPEPVPGDYPDGYYLGITDPGCSTLCQAKVCYTATATSWSNTQASGYYCGTSRPAQCNNAIPGLFCNFSLATNSDPHYCWSRFSAGQRCGLPDGWYLTSSEASSASERCRSGDKYVSKIDGVNYNYCGVFKPPSCDSAGNVKGILCDNATADYAYHCYHGGRVVGTGKCMDPDATATATTYNAKKDDGYFLGDVGAVDCYNSCKSGVCHQETALSCPGKTHCTTLIGEYCGASPSTNPGTCNGVNGSICNDQATNHNADGRYCHSRVAWGGDNKCGLPDGHVNATTTRCRSTKVYATTTPEETIITYDLCANSSGGVPSCNTTTAGIICSGTEPGGSLPTRQLCYSGYLDLDGTCKQYPFAYQ